MRPAPLMLLLLAATAHGPSVAEELPYRAAGLWQISEQLDGEWAPMVRELCIAPDGERGEHRLSGLDPGDCHVDRIRRSGAAWITDATCVLADITTTVRSVTRGDFTTRVRTESKMRHEPAMPDGSIASTVIQEANRLGPCPAGMQPGERRL